MEPRNKLYYQTRTVVRILFWAAIVVGLFMVGDFINKSDENLCPVALERDFTWNSTNGEIVNIYQCQHPTHVRLLEDGRWEWAE